MWLLDENKLHGLIFPPRVLSSVKTLEEFPDLEGTTNLVEM